MTGKVTLVGAGPGGRGLLTIAGAQAIARADAVVYDRLVDEDILGLIPEEAERVKTLLEEEMSGAVSLSVPLTANAKTGRSWAEAH